MSKTQPTEAEFEKALRRRLRMARAASGARNGDLASDMGMAASTISGWFSGSGALPGPGRLQALAGLLSTTLADLLTKASEDLEIPQLERSDDE